MLWQAVTLWLVNRGLAVRRGRPVEKVYNRQEATWYENHAFRLRQSDQSESRVEPVICNRSEASLTSLTIRLARRYMSLHLSLRLTTNCVPLSRIKWERYIFYKEVCFVSLIEFRSLSLILFLVGSMKSIQHIYLSSSLVNLKNGPKYLTRGTAQVIIIIIIIIIIYSFRVFHISVSWWFFTGVWVTASLLKSPGLVSGFWLFLAMLSFG